MRDYQRIDVETTWNRARVLLKLDALRAPADSDDPKVVEKFMADHPRLDDYVYIVYPRLAEALYDTSKLTPVENGFSQLPGVTHKGHDVYVYWSYVGDPNEAWGLLGPEFLLTIRDNKPYEQTPQERAITQARRAAREAEVLQAKQARIAKIASDRTLLETAIATDEASKRVAAEQQRAQRKQTVVAMKAAAAEAKPKK